LKEETSGTSKGNILRCLNPEDVPKFIGYLKQESAHAINQLVGRRKKTIWARGYDKPIFLDYQKFLNKFAYTILNPWKDQQVQHMDNYKGVSSWNLFMEDKDSRICRMISRSSITPLEDPRRPWKESHNKLMELFKKNKKEISVKFSFYTWKECFPETADLSDSEVRKLMLDAIQTFSEETGKTLPHKSTYTDQSKQSILETYTPEKFSKRMICLSYFKELRINFIDFYKEQVRLAREVFSKWKLGDLSVPYPPGMFPPNLPRLTNLVPQMIPI